MDGRLVCALTRGDGRQGDEVTANVLTMKDVPRELPRSWQDVFPEPGVRMFEIRGEAYLSLSRFEALNREREKKNRDGFHKNEFRHEKPVNVVYLLMVQKAPYRHFPIFADKIPFQIDMRHP